jgi:GGDEF domain-containing protein
MTEKPPSQDRSQALPALLAAALAAVAIVVAVISLVSETPSLSLIAAAIATLLAMVVVWLNGNYVAQGQRLISAESELTRLQSTTIADSVAMRITGERPAGLDTIRTPGGDLTGLNLSDMSDLADPTTGLLGERYFVITLEARVAAARRHLRPLALILLEAVHDPTGSAPSIDAVIAADVIRETLRDADTLCRLHNGRYAILLEDTPENGAIWTVERIRRRLGEQLDDVAVWAGIACYPANGFDGPEVLDRARTALDQAREWRQDRTEVADT